MDYESKECFIADLKKQHGAEFIDCLIEFANYADSENGHMSLLFYFSMQKFLLTNRMIPAKNIVFNSVSTTGKYLGFMFKAIEEGIEEICFPNDDNDETCGDDTNPATPKI